MISFEASNDKGLPTTMVEIGSAEIQEAREEKCTTESISISRFLAFHNDETEKGKS